MNGIRNNLGHFVKRDFAPQILECCAEYPDGFTAADLAMWVGMSSGHASKALREARQAGIVDSTALGGPGCLWGTVAEIERIRMLRLTYVAKNNRRSVDAILRKRRRETQLAKQRKVDDTERDAPVQRIVPAAHTQYRKRGPASVFELGQWV